MTDLRDTALAFSRKNQERFLEELKTFIAIPSISTDADRLPDIQNAADYLVKSLKELGFDQAQVYQTKGKPVVIGEKRSLKPDAQTVMIYGHYDVQPADPLDQWKSDPFKADVRGEYLYARGCSDMKGQIWAALKAVESIQAVDKLSVNIKCIFEGEEEIGSPHLDEWIAEHTDLLKCDVVLNPDTGMLGKEIPTITYGLRGLCYFEIKLFGPQHDLHSGLFGGVIHNPANALCELIAGMHDKDGRVTLAGFYERAIPISDEEREQFKRLPLGDDFYREQTGVAQLWGEKGYTSAERVGARPTLDVNGIYSGFIGEGSKTIIPAWSMAKISMRLVPDQDPSEIRASFKKYIDENIPEGLRWEFKEHSSNPASLSDRNSPAVKALVKALESVWGIPPVFKREGGSVPVVLTLQKYLGVDSVLTGFGLPDDNVHAPNEHLHLPTWRRGIETLIHFFYNLNKID